MYIYNESRAECYNANHGKGEEKYDEKKKKERKKC